MDLSTFRIGKKEFIVAVTRAERDPKNAEIALVQDGAPRRNSRRNAGADTHG